MKTLGSILLSIAGFACACDVSSQDRVYQDEKVTYNDPNAQIVCPEGTEKRTSAIYYRELDSEWSPDDPFPPPPSYVAPAITKLPEIKVPRSFLVFPKAGYASIRVVVGKTGSIDAPVVVCSTGAPFEKAAIKALPSARFSPATLDGVPQRSVAILPFNFKVE